MTATNYNALVETEAKKVYAESQAMHATVASRMVAHRARLYREIENADARRCSRKFYENISTRARYFDLVENGNYA